MSRFNAQIITKQLTLGLIYRLLPKILLPSLKTGRFPMRQSFSRMTCVTFRSVLSQGWTQILTLSMQHMRASDARSSPVFFHINAGSIYRVFMFANSLEAIHSKCCHL